MLVTLHRDDLNQRWRTEGRKTLPMVYRVRLWSPRKVAPQGDCEAATSCWSVQRWVIGPSRSASRLGKSPTKVGGRERPFERVAKWLPVKVIP
jgi:hypothetical protein